MTRSSQEAWSTGARPAGVWRPSAIFVGLVAITVAGGAMAWSGYGNVGFDVFLMVVGGWLVSLSLHEYAHAVVAYHHGDTGVAERGYLTLNPFKYTHPLLSVVMPVFVLLIGGIGLPGGAVWVDRSAIRSRWADSLISVAGPAVNVACALLLAVPFAAGVDTGAHPQFWAGWAFLAFIQVTAAVLNLLPVPGLDGGNALLPWLSHQWRRRAAVVAPFGLIIVFVVLFDPRVGTVFFTTVWAMSQAVGVPQDLAAAGYSLLRFWS